MIDNQELYPLENLSEHPEEEAVGAVLSANSSELDGEEPNVDLTQAEPEEVLTPEEIRLRERREMARALGLITQIGITMIICVALGMIFGNILDRILGSSPWLLIIGAFLGGGSAIKVMIDISNGTKK